MFLSPLLSVECAGALPLVLLGGGSGSAPAILDNQVRTITVHRAAILPLLFFLHLGTGTTAAELEVIVLVEAAAVVLVVLLLLLEQDLPSRRYIFAGRKIRSYVALIRRGISPSKLTNSFSLNVFTISFFFFFMYDKIDFFL